MQNRIADLRARMRAAGDPTDGEAQQRYHKSALAFFGLRAPQLRAIVRTVFPPDEPMDRACRLALIRKLWQSAFFDERVAAVFLLERVTDLGVGNLDDLHAMTRDCAGWALLDALACKVLGPLALREGDPSYRVMRGWSDDPWMWTRRASILVHVIPARRRFLAHDFAWSTFEDRLFEKEFFIRKAIGWTLRECSKRYPDDVFEFLDRVGDRASGLTRREGSRRLPDDLRTKLGRRDS